MISNKLKLITFDATNTILKFYISPWKFYANVAENHGYQVPEEDIKKHFISTYKVLSQQHPNFGKESILWENWWREVVQGTFKNNINDINHLNSIANNLIEDYKSPKCWIPADGTLDLLEYLKSRYSNLGVVSNFDPRLHEILHKLNLSSYFNFVLTSYEFGFSKPDKKIFESAITHSQFKVSASECLHIGDDYENDFIGAKKAGWHAVLITDDTRKVKDVNPKLCFKNLQELKQAIEHQDLLI